MAFSDDLKQWTAAEIIAALGCPQATAYQWREGRRTPPEWLQPHLLAILKAATKAPRRKRQG